MVIQAPDPADRFALYAGLATTLLTWLGILIAWRVKGAKMEHDVGTLMHGDPGNPNRRAARIDDVNAVGEKVNRNEKVIEMMGARLEALVEQGHHSSASIIAHIQGSRMETSQALSQINVQVAKLEGKSDVCVEIARGFDKLSDSISDAIKDERKGKGDR